MIHSERILTRPRRCCSGLEDCRWRDKAVWHLMIRFERSCCNSVSNAVSTTSIRRSSSRRAIIRATRASGIMSTNAMAWRGRSPLERQSTSIYSWLNPRLRTSLFTSGSQRATAVRVNCVSISSHSSASRKASKSTESMSRGCILFSMGIRWR